MSLSTVTAYSLPDGVCRKERGQERVPFRFKLSNERTAVRPQHSLFPEGMWVGGLSMRLSSMKFAKLVRARDLPQSQWDDELGFFDE